MSDMPASFSTEHHAAVPLWRDIRVLRWLFQIAILIVVVAGLFVLGRNLVVNLSELGLNLSFDFVGRRAGFTISEGGLLDVQRFAILVPSGSDIDSLDDLDGQPVVAFGDATHDFLAVRTERAGMAPDIQTVNNAARAIAVFQSGEVSAIVGRRSDLLKAAQLSLEQTGPTVIYNVGFRTRFVKPFDTEESMLAAYWVGVLNTIRAAGVGIVLATILGTFVGIARLSNNWLISRIALVYIEIMQNTPLLVQLFFWFTLVKALPAQRVDEILSLPGKTLHLGPLEISPVAYFSQRAAALPGIERLESWGRWWPFVIAAFILAAVAWRVRIWMKERQGHPPTGQLWWATISFFGMLALGWALMPGAPLRVVIPRLEGDAIATYQGGWILSSNFQAVLLGLVLYTAAFIAEAVRSGIQAVDYGQIEAATSIGLTRGQRLRLVILPQAMRVTIPPLINQYLNLTKNSSLAIAVGYPDLFNTSQTIGNQTGQNVQVIILVMGTYLSFSLIISLIMNSVNRRMQIVER